MKLSRLISIGQRVTAMLDRGERAPFTLAEVQAAADGGNLVTLLLRIDSSQAIERWAGDPEQRLEVEEALNEAMRTLRSRGGAGSATAENPLCLILVIVMEALRITPPSAVERLEFWKYAYARSSFVQTRTFIELLIREDPGFNTTLRRALTVAILVTYCRPFKQRKPVKLNRDVVPARYLWVHNEAVELRDKVLAHRDVDGPVADWGFISQLRVTIEAPGVVVDTLSPNLNNGTASELASLIHELVDVMEKRTAPLLRRLHDPIPANGTYTVSLEENPSRWLEPVEGGPTGISV